MQIEYCEHCGQKMMVYRRNIRLGMARALRDLFKTRKRGKAKVSDFSWPRGIMADFTKLKYWGLIESPEPEHWQITQRGILFILGKIAIPKYRWIYNNQIKQDAGPNKKIFVWDIEPEEISKESVLADASHYHEYIQVEKLQPELFV